MRGSSLVDPPRARPVPCASCPTPPFPTPRLRAALQGVRGAAAGPRRRPDPQGCGDPGRRGGDRGAGPARVPVPRGDQHVARLAGDAGPAGARASASRRPPTASSPRCRRRRTCVRREYGDRPVYVDHLRRRAGRVRRASTWSTGAATDAAPDEVAAVILGDSPDELTKANLDRAFRLVRGGAALIGMHRNPGGSRRQGPTLDAGAFLVGLEWATERRARIVGKPSPAFFRMGVERLAAEARGARRAAPPAPRAGHGGRRRVQRHRRRPAGRPAQHLRPDRQARRRGADGRRGTGAAAPYAPDGIAPSIVEVVAALG